MKDFTLTLDRAKKYLLGFSGGADSVCLFHLLRCGGYSFSVAHVNHGIRGCEADRDEELCRSIAERYGIEFRSLHADVPAIAKSSGESLEEAARRVRYSFFEQVMREGKLDVLLTAHNADDNAETLLLALARGCSPSGACGIAPVRRLACGEVRRPLISLSKRDILDFCLANAYDFVTDSTNSDISYPRNRIRKNILPELEAINPMFLSAIERFTEAQREDRLYLDSIAEEYAEELDCSVLSSLPLPLSRRALSIAAYRAGASPEAKHIERLIDMVRSSSGKVSLPGSITALCEGGRIVFKRDTRKRAVASYPDYGIIPIHEGDNPLPCGTIRLICGELTNDSVQIYNLSTNAHINLDTINGKLYARARRAGDSILIRGMHRSVKKLISRNAAGLTPDERRALPVLCCGEDIVWIPGLEVADPHRGNAATLYYINNEENR